MPFQAYSVIAALLLIGLGLFLVFGRRVWARGNPHGWFGLGRQKTERLYLTLGILITLLGVVILLTTR
jgi:hypothetical protein